MSSYHSPRNPSAIENLYGCCMDTTVKLLGAIINSRYSDKIYIKRVSFLHPESVALPITTVRAGEIKFKLQDETLIFKNPSVLN